MQKENKAVFFNRSAGEKQLPLSGAFDKHTMGRRRRARELAIQVLFHMEFAPGDPEEVFKLVCENFKSPMGIRPFSKQLVLGVCEKKEDLDRLIVRSSKHWRLERMPHVDRNILRVGVYEILFRKDIPPKVSMDEAVELGKKYGTEDSGAFINGVLDDIYNNLMLEGDIERT
jgi:transcription antitermination factor NusB